MQAAKPFIYEQCIHAKAPEPGGLAFITIGKTMRGKNDDGTDLYDALSEESLGGFCRFDLGSYTSFLADCLHNHKAAIIVDSTSYGTAPGTVSLIDVSAVTDGASPINIQSSHGASIAEELRVAQKRGRLPKRIILLGLETAGSSAARYLDNLPKQSYAAVVANLTLLIRKVLETLQRLE